MKQGDSTINVTGRPAGLLQDDDRKLSRWFASRPGARRLVDLRCEELRKNTMTQDITSARGAAYALRSAMHQAFNLGKIYLQQADSESYAEQDESGRTYKKYKALLEETCTTLAASAPVAPTMMVDMVPPATSRDRWMYEQGRLAERDPRTSKAAPVAPAPQPAGFVLVPVEPTPEMVRAAYSGPIQGGLEAVYANMLAAAPKAAPAINKVSDIIDAYGMTPGEPERVADIPGLAEALEAAFADGSAQVTGALRQGEYLPLPEPDTHCYDDDKQVDVWSHSAEQMRAYGEANWKAGYKQGALADASPDNRVPEAWTNLLAYVLQDDMHNQLTPRVVDIAYTAFMQAKRPNDEDGGASDWFNDTKPKVAEMIAKLRKDLIEELAAQPADTSTAVLQWIVKTASEAKEPCGENPESPAAIRNAKLAAIAGEAAQALGIVRGLSYDIAAPQPVQPAPKQPRWITHVAIKYAGVVYSLVAPKRHCDIHLKLIRQSGGLHGPTFHGFLDNYGNFLSRAEAFIIAKQAGQIKPGMRIDGFLYSEDVW